MKMQLNHAAVNTESPESGKWEKLNIQKPRQEPGLSNNPYARYSKTRFSQIYKALYGVPLKGANMAAGNLINTEYELPKDFKSMITKAKNDINVVNSYVVVIDHRQVIVVKWAISIDEDKVPLI